MCMWTESNRIIVLYPQVNASSAPYNPQGCWDWFGYTGMNYALKSGPQLLAVQAMIDRLATDRSAGLPRCGRGPQKFAASLAGLLPSVHA
jgi:hypothetical protein